MKTFFSHLKLIKILGIFFILILNSYDANSQISIVTERIRKNLFSQIVNDIEIANYQSVNDSEITNYLSTLNANGSWSDIDYKNTSRTNWPAARHSARLKSICSAYNKPTSIHYHVADVKNKIQCIINFYISTKPKSANWWYNSIGAPISLGPALILMKTGDSFGFDQDKLDSYSDQLLNYFSESASKSTGANKLWLLSSSIDKACIKNNDTVLGSNFKSAFEEAKIMTGSAEGIKSDYSFYQHGNQLYCGGYGMAFMSDITNFGMLAYGTSYQMSENQLQVITDAIINGFLWFCQKGAFDFGAVGREISRHGAASTSALKTVVDRLRTMNVSRSGDLTECYKFLDGTANFPNPGNKHFWKSDIMVQHGSTFYMSARVPSKRTMGSECMNNENLKNKWLSWGATNIMINGDEYRNIFAVWDWSRIPGVTSIKEEVQAVSVSTIRSSNEFAGGVSNGVFGLAAYDYSRDGISGRKSYFFTPEAMYCFGAGINGSKSKPVITNINQCFSSGTVTVKNNGSKSTIEKTEKTFPNLRWIYHNNVGYFLPSGGEITVKNMNQSGSWHDINTSESQTEENYKVFSAWIEHGNSPVDGKYEYIVVPSKSLAQFEGWVKSNKLKMIINTPDIQAVYDRNAGVYGLAFYKAGKLMLKSGLTVEPDKACLLLIQTIKNGKGYKISVSDPTATFADINVKLSGKLKGPGVVINSDKTSTIYFELPLADEAGKSITGEYTVGQN